jgi:predicted lactoylglutathione lyase
VKNLQRSVAFFKGLGYGFNAQFTDETAACMVISEEIFAMLLTEARYREFTRNPEARSAQVLTGLWVESRARVDQLVDRALALGGREIRDPEDHGSMYGRTFSDLDGHVWEIISMDPGALRRG